MRIWRLGLSLLAVGMLLFSLPHFLSSVPSSAELPSPVPSPEPTLQYEQQNLPQSTVHILLIPAQSQFVVAPAVADAIATIEEFASVHQAIAVLNGGFFDPVNQQSTSYVTLNGAVVADPTQNDRLMQNPDLQSYLTQILNRSEFRRYQCGQTVRYDIALHQEPPLPNCQMIDALGGGPRLLPELTAVSEGFVAEANGTVIRDAIGSQQPNARTAIGIKSDGSVVWVMAAQQSDTPSGLSLPALADVMRTLGVEQALNLDGGSSSALYYDGTTHYGKLDANGRRIQRAVKSVLFVQQPQRVPASLPPQAE